MSDLLIALLVLLVVVAVAVIGFVVLRSRRQVPGGGVDTRRGDAPKPLERRPTAVVLPEKPAVREEAGVQAPSVAVDEAPAKSSGVALEEPELREVDREEVATEEVDAAEVSLLEPIGERPRFRDRIGKARGALGGYFGGILGRSAIDQTTWDDLEEALIVADVGPGVTSEIIDDLKSRVKTDAIKTPDALMENLKADLKKRLAPGDRTLRLDPGVTNVWLFVGVNGVGKTTTIGKIARREVANERKVLMAAGDTFRAAAADQLAQWADRAGCDIVRGAEGGDPASVIYDAIESAASKHYDLVLADTAGRLQTKTNLMEELRKIRRVADREPGRVTETLLVLDATTGQNGLNQAEQFAGAADITGIVLTKLDGSAKGGIAFAIQTKLGIPIKLVGLGEKVEDLVPFDPDEYVEALFAE